MKTSRHLVYAESKDTPNQPVMQGPFTVAQHRAFEAWVEMRLYSASRDRFRDLMTDDFDPNEAEIKAEVETECRRQTWKVDGVTYAGEEVGHFCPGYYDCLRCYPD